MHFKKSPAYKKAYGNADPMIITPWMRIGDNKKVEIFLSFGATEAKPPEDVDAIFDITETGTTLAQNNLITIASQTITPGSYTSGSTTYTLSVYVSLSTTVPTPFMSLWGRRNTTVSTVARAAVVPDGNFCVLALENGNNTGVTFQGNTNANLGCGVATNASTSPWEAFHAEYVRLRGAAYAKSGRTPLFFGGFNQHAMASLRASSPP